MPRPSGSDTHPFSLVRALPGPPPYRRCWLRSTLPKARVELERGRPQMGSGRRTLVLPSAGLRPFKTFSPPR